MENNDVNTQGTADSFAFRDAEQTSPNIVATMHIEKLTRRNNDSKGGLMIRASRDPDAAHVSLLVKSADGITMFTRPSAGAETESYNVGVWAEDMELKLEKTGDSVKCSYKHASAAEWYDLITVNATFSGTYYVGQAVSSNDWGDHVQLTTGAVAVTVV